jgi:prepilin-type processing-associated H-X9-DG protein
MSRKGFTHAELVIVIAIGAVLALVLLPACGVMTNARAARERADCQSNLKQFAIAFVMYAGENQDQWPPMQPFAKAPDAEEPAGEPIFAAPDPDAIYPDYVKDLSLARCPSEPDTMRSPQVPQGSIEGHLEAIEQMEEGEHRAQSLRYFRAAVLGQSYWYHGYDMKNVDEFYGVWNATGMAPFASETLDPPPTGTAPVQPPVRMKDWTTDLKLERKLPWSANFGTGWNGSDTVKRLYQGIERTMITDVNDPRAQVRAQSEIVVMFDAFGSPGPKIPGAGAGVMVFNHMPGGSNVLYMDGHVEFVEFGQKFPVLMDAEQGGIIDQVGQYG